ncbi:MAG: hypothetical protein SGI72_03025 [Planctomycetota bacterium]|nr:hypothetical protein [Planctomycetota bacterium]
MSEWKYTRRQAQCAACTSAFQDGEKHVSALVFEGEDLRREDHCTTCFTRRDNVGDLFFWFTRHRVGKRALQLDLATLEALFLRLEGRPEPRIRELRYVLCLLLMRKRRLKLDRVVRGETDGEAMILHRPRRKEVLKVYVFDFSPERLDALKSDLLGLLEGAEPSSTDESPSETREEPDADVGLASASETLAGAGALER